MLFGFLLAGLSAVGHASVDFLRKTGPAGLTSTQIVAYVAVVDGLLGGLALLFAGWDPLHAHARAVLLDASASAVIRLASLVMYQFALASSPLSVTTPYLAFSPVLVILNAYISMGEAPSRQGIVGVVTLTVGGYLLSRVDGGPPRDVAPREPKPSKPNAFGSCLSFDIDSGSPREDRLESGAFLPAGDESAVTAWQLHQSRLSSELGHRAAPSPPPLHLEPSSDQYGRSLSRLQRRGSAASMSAATAPKSGPKATPAPGVMWALGGVRLHRGSVLVLGVVLLWSWSTTFDKLGILEAPTFMHYLALQRVLCAVPPVATLLVSPRLRAPLAGLTWRDVGLLLAICAAELFTVLFHFWSMRYLLLGYAVSAKRMGILVSVAVGALVFKEDVLSRLPYIGLMMAGMLLIILSPDHHHAVAATALPRTGA